MEIIPLLKSFLNSKNLFGCIEIWDNLKFYFMDLRVAVQLYLLNYLKDIQSEFKTATIENQRCYTSFRDSDYFTTACENKGGADV